MTRKGTIRKWCTTWGIVNSYPPNSTGVTPPDRFFVHQSKIAPDSGPVSIGTRIEFTPGEARSASELPTALDIVVVEQQPAAAAVNS
jgi:hypothetical protein